MRPLRWSLYAPADLVASSNDSGVEGHLDGCDCACYVGVGCVDEVIPAGHLGYVWAIKNVLVYNNGEEISMLTSLSIVFLVGMFSA